ncbi:MAG: sigma-54-dependent Fis family transcriptional regulator, partial [bacterium]|nr:sigma-54-dependent Fis family transcriptional regulator [bacterium]
IGEVIDKVLAEEAAAMEIADLILDSSSRHALENHNWPGNIRQLRYAMRYACAITDGNILRLEHFPPDLFCSPALDAPVRKLAPQPLQTTGSSSRPHEVPCCDMTDADALLRDQMIDTLRKNQWQVKLSAQKMGMSRATFYRKLARFKIISPNKRERL